MRKTWWHCVRQTAGPLVKESRALRPRLSAHDGPYERASKNKILKPPRDSAVRRTSEDRLELNLALFGFDGWCYVLEFRDDTLPKSFDEVRKAWRSMLYRMRKWHGEPFDYVYIIEGRHGEARWHIHLVVNYDDFPPVIMEDLWTAGYVYKGEPLLKYRGDTYRRTAKYFCKERHDGGVIPLDRKTWVASQTLTRRLPPAEYFRSDSGKIRAPSDVRVCYRNAVENPFGRYHYACWIEQDPLHPYV